MKNLTQINFAPPGGFKGFGKLGLDSGASANTADVVFQNFISSVIGLMSIIGIIWFVFLLISGAIGYMSAGNDKASLEAAKKKIVNGLIGLFLVIFGIFILKLFGYIFGIQDILNLPSMINKISG